MKKEQRSHFINDGFCFGGFSVISKKLIERGLTERWGGEENLVEHSAIDRKNIVGVKNRAKNQQRRSLLAGVSLLPLLVACNNSQVDLNRGKVAPIQPDTRDKINTYDSTYDPEKIEDVTLGSSEADAVIGGLLTRDHGSSKLSSSYGSGDDEIIGIGVSLTAQYIEADFKNVAGTDTDFSKVLYLNQFYHENEIFTTVNANRLSTIVSGDTLHGNAGHDSLFLFGQHRFYRLEEKGKTDPFTGITYDAFRETSVVLDSIENIYIHAGTLLVSAKFIRDLQRDQSNITIQGDGRAILWIKTPVDVAASNSAGRFVGRKYESIKETDTYKRFQISDTEELKNYIVDLRTMNLKGFDRLHIEAGTAIILRFGVETDQGYGTVEGVLKGLSMITGEGAIVFEGTGNVSVPNLENLWISRNIEILVAGRTDDSLASRDGSRGGSKEIAESNLFDTTVNEKTFLKLGISVSGSSQDDTMDGTRGNDKLSGGAGDDVLNGDEGDDEFSSGIGRDQIITGSGKDTIVDVAGALNRDTILDFSYDDKIKIEGLLSVAGVSAKINDRGGERRIEIDINGDGNPDLYIVLAKPTDDENKLLASNRVYNDLDTHFQVVLDTGGVLLIPSKTRDIENVNQAPEQGLIFLKGPYAIKENEVGSLVAQIQAIDPDSPADGNGRHGFQITEDSQGYYKKFTLSSSGELRLKVDSSFNFEETRLINIFVEVFDNPGPTGEKTANSLSRLQAIEIMIEDVNEVPVFETFNDQNTIVGVGGRIFDDGSLVTVNVRENTTFVLKFPKAIEQDLGDSIYYRLEGRNSDLFTFDLLTQTIEFKEPADYELRPGDSYFIRLVASDANGLSSSKEIAVTVEDVNEAPAEENPLPVQWVIVGDEKYSEILGIEDIFRDPEYEELRRLESEDSTEEPSLKTLTYRYQDKATGNVFSWLSQPDQQEGTDRYGMKIDKAKLEEAYGKSRDLYREFEIEVFARDQSGLEGKSTFKLIVSYNKPPIISDEKIETAEYLTENGSFDQRSVEDRETFKFLEGVIDPEEFAMKIRTTIPMVDADGNMLTNAGELYQQIYWGKYGYLIIEDIDLTLNRAGGKNPNSQKYSYYLISDPEDLVRVKQVLAQLEKDVESRRAKEKALNISEKDSRLKNLDENLMKVDDKFLQSIFDRVNSLSLGERADEEIDINIEDYGLDGDRETPSSFVTKTVVLKVDGANDAPTKQGELSISVREPGDAFTAPDTGDDASAVASGGIGALMENIRDVDTRDELRAAEGSIPKEGIGELMVEKDGSYRFIADHGKDSAINPSAVDSLSEGEALTYKFLVQVDDGKGGAVTNEVLVNIVGRNDAPLFDETLFEAGTYKGLDFNKLRFSQDSVHEFDMPIGSFSDVDKKDTLTYSYTAQQGIDETGAIINYEVVDISNWFSIDASTGKFFINRPPSSSGDDTIYKITITASDGRASVEGEFTFTVYKNLPPFHEQGSRGSSKTIPFSILNEEVSDLTPQEVRDISSPVVPTTKHIITGDAFELLGGGIEDITALLADSSIRVEPDDPTDEKFNKLDIVSGTYKGKYGTMVVSTKVGGTQTYTYTLDYDAPLTDQLKQDQPAEGDDAEAIAIHVRDKGGLIGEHWVSLSIKGVNDAPISRGEYLYTVSENIGTSSPRVNPLENVSDPDGDVDPSTSPDQDTIYVWSVLSVETGDKQSLDRLINLRTGSLDAYDVGPITVNVKGRYGTLQVFRKNVNGQISYDTKYLVDPNSIDVEKLSLNDSLIENFTFTIGDGVLPTQTNAYSTEQSIQVQISGENDKAVISPVPEITIQSNTTYKFDLNAYVQDPDSTKIYQIKSVTKDGVLIANYLFLNRDGSVGGINTLNELTFSPGGADLGSYQFTFTTSDTSAPNTILVGEELLLRLEVVATPGTVEFPAELDLTGTGSVAESNQTLYTIKGISYPVVTPAGAYRPAEGKYGGKYGYIEVIRGDVPVNDRITYYLDNLDPDTDALAEGEDPTEEILVDLELLGLANRPIAQQIFKILVNGVNDIPVVKQSLNALVNLANDDTFVDISRSKIIATIDDPDAVGLSFEFSGLTGSITRIQGTYGYIEKLGGDNYRYIVDPFNDTNLARIRLVKGLKQGESVTETFEIKVSDVAGGEVTQILNATVIGADDLPEIIKADVDNNIVIRFLQGGAGAKFLTGTYVQDPDGDEIQYRQLGNVEKDGIVITDGSVIFDAAAGSIMVTENARAGTYTLRTLIQNPFSLPIAADGNVIKVIVSDTTSDNLDLLDTELSTAGDALLQVIEGTDGILSNPLSIEEGYLTETKIDSNGFNPRPVAVDNARSTYGTYSIDEFTGSFTYQLDDSNPLVNALDRGESLEDLIAYEVVDDYGTRDRRSIKIEILGSNDSTSLEIKALPVDGFELEQKNNTVSDDARVYNRLFSTAQIALLDPESGTDFSGAVLTLSVTGDSDFADNFKFAFASLLTIGGGKVDLSSTKDSEITLGGSLYTVVLGSEIKFKFKAGATNTDIVNLLQGLQFHLESTFVEAGGVLVDGGGYKTTGNFARFEGLTLNVMLTEGGKNSKIRILDTRGDELEDESGRKIDEIPITVKLQGFNRYAFTNNNNFVRDITPLGLVVAFDGQENKKDQMKFENNGGDHNPFEIISFDDDGDGITDRFVLRSKDMGGTEYIVRELASGGVLAAGATKFTVTLGLAGVNGADTRHVTVTYDALPNNAIITSPEIDTSGTLLTEAEQADQVGDLGRPAGVINLNNLQIFTGGGDDNLYDNHGDLDASLEGLFGFSNTIYLGAGNDSVFGAGGNDQLYGGSGNDWLRGGLGNDDLIGGRGSDTYEWNNINADAALHDIVAVSTGAIRPSDRIIGYDITENDVIDLKNLVFKDNTGTDLVGIGTVLAGTDYVRIEPGTVGLPTEILIDINGDGVFDQEISLWLGEIGEALGAILDVAQLQPDLLVPAFGTNIKLPDVFAYVVVNLVSDALNPLGSERLTVQTITPNIAITGNFTLGPGALGLEVLGADKDLFTVRAGKIVFDRVATVEYIKEDYLLLVRATHKTTTGVDVTSFGTHEIKLTSFPGGYEIKTGGADKVLAPGTALSIVAPLDYLLFEGDDIFGTAYLGNHRGINANNVIYAGAGADVVYTGDGSDEVYGGSSNDIIWSGLGSDTIEGGSGNDELVLTGGTNIVDGGSGDDKIWLSSSLWERKLDSEELSTTATSIGETEVLLGSGKDRLLLQRDGVIKVDLQDISFEAGDVIDLSHYVVLPKTGTSVLHIPSYILIKSVVGGMVMYIDREGLGHFAEPTLAGGAFEADAVIAFKGSIEDGVIKDGVGNAIDLQLNFGTAVNYSLEDALDDTTTPNVVSTYLRDEGSNDYGLFLTFDEDVAFGRIGDWQWEINLRSSVDNSLLKVLRETTNGDKFFKPSSAAEVPQGVDYEKTLYWGFNQNLGLVSSTKLDIVSLSKGGNDFEKVNDLRVRFDDAAEPSITPFSQQLQWALDATDNSKNTADPRWAISANILEDPAFQRYEVLGQYGNLFQYEGGELKRSTVAFDVSLLDSMSRELHLTLVAYNERGSQKRVDFIIERELPPIIVPSFEEEIESYSIPGFDTGVNGDWF